LVQRFIYSKSTKKYILGINKLTKSVQKYIKVDGIIDDFTRVQRSRKKEILKIEEVPKDAIILWVSTGSPLEVKHKLDSMGFANLSYLAFFKYSGLNLKDPPFITDFRDDFKNNIEKYKYVYNILNDQKSKDIFIKIINFKISFDYKFMDGFTNNHTEQYFDKELINNIDNLVFFDGGGYIGDTTAQVIKNYPNYKHIYLVEPIKEHIKIAKRDLKEFKNIQFIQSGISNSFKTLNFHEEKSFSTTNIDSNNSIQVDTIDNIIDIGVSYIKLDIEGSEQDAIDGAKKTITKYKPILAICIYHKAEDWHEIPKKVLAINKDYKVYIRHYMEGIYETVMYFI